MDDTFAKRGYFIHINSPEEARAVYEYYNDRGLPIRENSSNEENCMEFPYLGKGFHSAITGFHRSDPSISEKVMEYDEWAEFVGVSDCELNDVGSVLSLFE